MSARTTCRVMPASVVFCIVVTLVAAVRYCPVAHGGETIVPESSQDSQSNPAKEVQPPESGDNASNKDFVVIKYDNAGKRQWLRRYDGPGRGDDWVTASAVDRKGNIYVTGASWGGENVGYEYATIKYDATGKCLWVRRHAGGIPKAIGLDENRNVYVGGEGGIIKYSSAGKFQWELPGAEKWTVSKYGDVITAHQSISYYISIKYYNSDGNFQWSKTFEPYSYSWEFSLRGIHTDDYGNAYIKYYMYYHEDSCDSESLRMYDRNGVFMWDTDFYILGNNGFGFSYIQSLYIDDQLNVYVAGQYIYENESKVYPSIHKLDANGELIWNIYHLNDNDAWTDAKCITLDIDGNIIVAGSRKNATNSYDYATIKYNSNGEMLWSKRYKGNKWGGATALSLDKKDNVFVTGTSDGGESVGERFATIKYDAAGNEKWVQHHKNPTKKKREDIAVDLKVDKRRNVFVSGYSVVNH